jgi:hypothetical protein
MRSRPGGTTGYGGRAGRPARPPPCRRARRRSRPRWPGRGRSLAGIYFAVQASYEQQIVNANQVALTSAVQQYKAAYAKELKKLPSLLKTAKATAFPHARPTRKD